MEGDVLGVTLGTFDGETTGAFEGKNSSDGRVRLKSSYAKGIWLSNESRFEDKSSKFVRSAMSSIDAAIAACTSISVVEHASDVKCGTSQQYMKSLKKGD